ncbi:hypothetical protein [Corynebacterium pyruviciproducens]
MTAPLEGVFALIFRSTGKYAYMEVQNGSTDTTYTLPRGSYQLICQAQGTDEVEVWLTPDPPATLQRTTITKGRQKIIPITSLGGTLLQATTNPRPNAGGSRDTICSIWVIQIPELEKQ